MDSRDDSAEVTRLLQILENDLSAKRLSEKERNENLVQLKILGRQRALASPLFEEKNINVLGQYGFRVKSSRDDSPRESLRCLANALWMEPKARQRFVDLGFAVDTAVRLRQSKSFEDVFLCSRLLFLLTYETNLDSHGLVMGHDMIECFDKIFGRRIALYSSNNYSAEEITMADTAISELLKLMFTLQRDPKILEMFSTLVSSLLELLSHTIQTWTAKKLEPPINHILNVLMDTPSEATASSIFPLKDPAMYLVHIFDVLDAATTEYAESELNISLVPCLTFILKSYAIAPLEARVIYQSRLLPSAKEREAPLGTSETLPSRLLRLSTASLAPNLQALIPTLLFEVSDKDAKKFVKNIGYGYASGFLATHGIKVPTPSANDDDTGERLEAERLANNGEQLPSEDEVNFVTGQYLDHESADEEIPMTDDEKMREAERLFVLFDRLKKTGVVDVENPVEAALRSGRFEELD